MHNEILCGCNYYDRISTFIQSRLKRTYIFYRSLQIKVLYMPILLYIELIIISTQWRCNRIIIRLNKNYKDYLQVLLVKYSCIIYNYFILKYLFYYKTLSNCSFKRRKQAQIKLCCQVHQIHFFQQNINSRIKSFILKRAFKHQLF